jgi:hypothetical protein
MKLPLHVRAVRTALLAQIAATPAWDRLEEAYAAIGWLNGDLPSYCWAIQTCLTQQGWEYRLVSTTKGTLIVAGADLEPVS